MNPGTDVNKSFFSTIGNANTPQNQEIADKKRMENVENKSSDFVSIDPKKLDSRFFTPDYMRMFGGYGALSQIHPENYDEHNDVFGRTVGSAPEAPTSASSTLFNYLTVTPGFTKVSSLNYQVYRDAKIQMYTPIRSLDNGKVVLDSRGIIASMTPVSESELPTEEQFEKYQEIGSDYKLVKNAPGAPEAPDITNFKNIGVYNPNFLFFVKVSDVTEGKLKEGPERRQKGKKIDQFQKQQTQNEKERIREMDLTKKMKQTEETSPEDAKKRNVAIAGILQRDKPLFDFTGYLKNDRYFSLLNSLTGFDIYEQNTLSSKKTYKGILVGVELDCPIEKGISLLSSNLKVILNVETWVMGLIGPNVYKIKNRQIKVDIGQNYPRYFANIMEKNDNLKGFDGTDVNEVLMNEVGSKYVGRYSSLDKKKLKELNGFLTSNNIKIDERVAKMIGERANSIKKFDEFIKTVNNPFVYKFKQTDIVHNDNFAFLQGKNCYEIGKESFVKWLGKFDSVTTAGEATFTKNYQNSICNSTYQFNFGDDVPVVLALRPITSAKWFMDLSNLTDELSSAFQQIYKDALLQISGQSVISIERFYANEKSRMAIEKLITKFNASLNNICGGFTDADTLLKDTIAKIKEGVEKIHEVLSSSNDLQEWENAINGVFAEGELECIINFVDLHTSTTADVSKIVTDSVKLQTVAKTIQDQLNNPHLVSSIKPEIIEEYNEIKRRFDERALSGLEKQAESLRNRVDKKIKPTAISEEHKDATDPALLKIENPPNAKFKTGDYVLISKMYTNKTVEFDNRYARVISSVLYPAKNNTIVYKLSVFFTKNNYEANLTNTLQRKDMKLTYITEPHLLEATKDDIEKSFENVALAQNELGGGGAKHTRRSHATGPRKNVTRHGNHGLIRRRTSHKGRKRGAHAKTAKK